MSKQKQQSIESIGQNILVLRGHRVMLDHDLAEIYGVRTTRLNQQVRRNQKRFPDDFAFQLTASEYQFLMLQNATSNKGRGGRRKLPLVFTEHGALMAANVLKTDRAVQMSVYVVRAFVRLRETLALHKELALKLSDLEQKVQAHDTELQAIISALRQLMTPPEQPKRRIGFDVQESSVRYRIVRHR
jgi:phage regulator Rha-like protein